MKYIVDVRSWTTDWTPKFPNVKNFAARFGKNGSIHELTDSEVVALIIEYGRAEITELHKELRRIDFQNDYD